MASKPPLPSPAVAGPSIARRQPLRQARTARKPATSKLTTNGTEPSAHHLPPAKFYPALTAFTDAVDALPSEIIRHFTLLREVDAKACLPEANLRALIDAAERLPAASDPYEFAFVAVSTSGLVAGYSTERKLEIMTELGRWVEERRRERGETAPRGLSDEVVERAAREREVEYRSKVVEWEAWIKVEELGGEGVKEEEMEKEGVEVVEVVEKDEEEEEWEEE